MKPMKPMRSVARMASALLTTLALAACATQGMQSAAAPVYVNPGVGKGFPFSEGVRHAGIYYLSGQLGVDRSTNKLATGGMAAEARQTMENIKDALARQKLTMNDLTKCMVMMVDMSEWGEFNKVYSTYFNTTQLPARSAFGVSALALGAKVEVECQAALH